MKAINEQERKGWLSDINVLINAIYKPGKCTVYMYALVDGEKELNIPDETLTDFNETTAHECKISEAKVKSRPTKQN